MDVYTILGEYAAYLQKEATRARGRGASSIKRRVSVVKLLLIFHDVDINEMKFKTKVKFAKSIRREKEAIDKNELQN